MPRSNSLLWLVSLTPKTLFHSINRLVNCHLNSTFRFIPLTVIYQPCSLLPAMQFTKAGTGRQASLSEWHNYIAEIWETGASCMQMAGVTQALWRWCSWQVPVQGKPEHLSCSPQCPRVLCVLTAPTLGTARRSGGISWSTWPVNSAEIQVSSLVRDPLSKQ